MSSTYLRGWGDVSSSSSSSSPSFIGEQKRYLATAEHHASEEAGLLAPGDADFALYVCLVALCVLFASFASGLTQGLLSLSPLEVQIYIRSGTADEKKYAALLQPIIKNHHLLLCTLMLWNASAFEALPIFLNKLVTEWQAIVISVTLILFAGEIIPSAILTGPNQLYLASKCVPLVWLVMILFFPVAYPISKLLDVVSTRGRTWSRRRCGKVI